LPQTVVMRIKWVDVSWHQTLPHRNLPTKACKLLFVSYQNIQKTDSPKKKTICHITLEYFITYYNKELDKILDKILVYYWKKYILLRFKSSRKKYPEHLNSKLLITKNGKSFMRWNIFGKAKIIYYIFTWPQKITSSNFKYNKYECIFWSYIHW
jgi:hypothetical protein